MLSATEPWLTRTRARYELLLAAHHDPDLAATMVQFGIKFYDLARDVVTQWHPKDPPVDPAVVHEQAVVVLTYINGVMMSFVQGYPVVTDVDHLERLIQAILRSIDTHGT
jgi:hypothetical protein